jgi:biofilm PGA synthesis N-glycosyltransferase PgaC
MQSVLAATPVMFGRGAWRLVPIWGNFLLSVVWAYAMLIGLALGLVSALRPDWTGGPLGFGVMPAWWGAVLALTYLLQSVVSVTVDSRFEKGLFKSLFWIIWYPLIFWLLQAFTAVLGAPRAVLRSKSQRGTWVSPDRGVR